MMSNEPVFHVFDLQVDMETQQVCRNNEPVVLTDLTAKLFFALFEKAPETVTTTELAATVWGRDFVSEETMAQRVRLLRQALGDDAKSSKYIKTERGVGYRLMTAPKNKSTLQLDSHKIVAVIASAILMVIAFVWWVRPISLEDNSSPSDIRPITDISSLDASFLAERARQYFSARRVEDINIAISLYEKALAKAPKNPNVQIGLSFALSTRATKFDTVVGDDTRAEVLARSALSQSDKNGSAWSALAYALDSQGKVEEATSAYLRAYSLNSQDRAAASSAAYLLSIRGKLYEAIKLDLSVFTNNTMPSYTDTQIALTLDLLQYSAAAQNWLEKALTLNPQHPVVISEAIRSSLRSGDHMRAEELYAKIGIAERSTPKLLRLSALMHMAKGDLETALAILETLEEAPSVIQLAVLALKAKGQKEQPQAIAFKNYRVVDTTWPEGLVDTAYLFAAYGMNNEAIQSLSHAIDLGWRDSRLMQQLPFFETIKNDPGYLHALNRIDRLITSERNLLNSDTALKKQIGISD
ncbi:MAG: winged helix-turn-helix domain-containing protein [Kordiimonas sp.]